MGMHRCRSGAGLPLYKVCCHKYSKLILQGRNMNSAWLSTTSALDRKLQSLSLSLSQYNMLLRYEEGDWKFYLDEDGSLNNENIYLASLLVEGGYLVQVEVEGKEGMIGYEITDHGRNSLEEVNRVCKSRLIEPLFTAFNS